MQSKTLFFPALMALLFLSISARSESGEETDRYTLQVAAFPDRAPADEFMSRVSRAGERPFSGTAELPGRGRWIRVFIGSFATISSARHHGESLVARGLIKEFLIRESQEMRSLSRPRTVTPTIRSGPRYESRPAISGTGFLRRNAPERISGETDHPYCCLPLPGWPFVSVGAEAPSGSEAVREAEIAAAATALPEGREISTVLAPPADPGLVPRPDALRQVFRMVANDPEPVVSLRKSGSLRLSGDRIEGLKRLRWIAGSEAANAICLDSDGRALIDLKALAKASGAAALPPSSATLVIADYVSSNDGLLLLVQMIYGQHNYLLHIGGRAPTAGEEVEITGSLNLDNNFDTRINPYRRLGKKLARELPPEGFDAMIAINPVARWFNLHSNQMVPIGHITFHELAESHAKIALGLNYLSMASRPGAHNVAIEREKRLKSQRPSNEIVLTAGSNRVLRSVEEIRRFTSETAHVSGQR